jgi:hypothetical protein
VDDAYEILDQLFEHVGAVAAAKELPIIACRARAGIDEKANQSPSNVGVESEGTVRVDIPLPERIKPHDCGPEPQDIVVVVLEDDPAARPDSAKHLAHRGPGIGNMLEQEARMGNIEASPLLVA